MAAGGEVGEGVGTPALAVEIDGEEVTGFIKEHGIDPHDEITGEVASDDRVGEGLPILVGAGVAFDPWFFANATSPFIATNGRVSGFAGFVADEAVGVDFVSATEERAEEGDLFRGRRGVVDGHELRSRCMVGGWFSIFWILILRGGSGGIRGI